MSYAIDMPRPVETPEKNLWTVTVNSMSELMRELKRCDEQQTMIFIKAGAVWCGPCKTIQPFFDALMQHWNKRVSLSVIEFNIDDAEQVSEYFNVSRIPHFICLLPRPHPTLTVKELRNVGGDPTKLEQWVTNIMQKWIVGIQPPFPFANTQPSEVAR